MSILPEKGYVEFKEEIPLAQKGIFGPGFKIIASGDFTFLPLPQRNCTSSVGKKPKEMSVYGVSREYVGSK